MRSALKPTCVERSTKAGNGIHVNNNIGLRNAEAPSLQALQTKLVIGQVNVIHGVQIVYSILSPGRNFDCSLLQQHPNLPFHVADDISFHAWLHLDSFQSFFDLRLRESVETTTVQYRQSGSVGIPTSSLSCQHTASKLFSPGKMRCCNISVIGGAGQTLLRCSKEGAESFG